MIQFKFRVCVRGGLYQNWYQSVGLRDGNQKGGRED